MAATKKERKTRTLTIRVSPGTREAIDKAAKADGVTPTEFARKAAERAAKRKATEKDNEKDSN
jgi:uncharacterized protein (DUF1778 family)